MEYESRGFISKGFLRGLNPRQFYFHAMSGREGVCDNSNIWLHAEENCETHRGYEDTT